MITAADVVRAWQSVTDEWIVRRNKAHDDGKQWEVVHAWGDVISYDTQRVLKRFALQSSAETLAKKCELEARGAAVLKIVNN